MYTRRTTFPLRPNTHELAREIGEKYGKVLHDLPGHVSTVMVVDKESFLSLSTWDTQDHAEAVKSTRDAAQSDLADILDGTPSTTITSTVVHDVR